MLNKMNEDSLIKLLCSLPINKIRYFETIDSTNDEAFRWLEEGIQGNVLIVADEQTKGRGRSGRIWYTPARSALAFSLVIIKTKDIGFAQNDLVSRITALGALAVSDALETLFNLKSQIKWPNDVLVNNQKLAGVLSELKWIGDEVEAVVLGIGVNILRSAVPRDKLVEFPAVSLEQCIIHKRGIREINNPRLTFDRMKILIEIISNIFVLLERFDGDQFLKKWETRLAFKNENVQIINKTLPESAIIGTLLGLRKDGALKVKNEDGSITYVEFGDLNLREVNES